MNKTFALYKNEMKRVFGRPLIWAGLALAAVLMLTEMFTERKNIIGRKFAGSVGEQYIRELEEQKNSLNESNEEYAQLLAETEGNLDGLRAEYESALSALEKGGEDTKALKEAKDNAEKAYINALNYASNAICRISVNKINIKVIEILIEYKLSRQDYRPVPLNDIRERFERTHLTQLAETKLAGALKRYEDLKAGIAAEEQEVFDKIESYREAIAKADFGFFMNELIRIAENEPDSFERTAKLEAYGYIVSAGTENVGLAAGQEAARKANEYVIARAEQLDRQEQYRGVEELTTKKLNLSVKLLAEDLKNGISAGRAERVVKLDGRLWPMVGGTDPNDIINLSLPLGLLAVLLTVAMIAGNAIAGDIRSGSIKSLIVAPVKRGRIFWAKVMMLLTVTFLMTAALTVFALLAGSAVSGVWDHGRVLFNSGDSPRILPFWLATFFSSLIDAAGIFFFALLALMLSAITRNAVVSSIVPVGYFVFDLFSSALGGMGSNRFVNAVLPMRNLGNLWFSREVSTLMNLVGLFENRLDNYYVQYIIHPFSRGYSVIYVAILAAATVWAARDAFCRRDIM